MDKHRILSLRDISHKYSDVLFENISLDINSGDKIAIIGDSGCGKSTLLHIMATFLKPTSGFVDILDKENIYHLNEKQIVYTRRHYISMIFQQHHLLKGFLALENLKVASIISNELLDDDILELFNLNNKAYLQSSSLSGGEQQRLSIVRALIKKPKIIFADEPTGNLDVKNSNIVMDSLFKYVDKNKNAMVVVTHDINLAKQCDKIYKLEDKTLALI